MAATKPRDGRKKGGRTLNALAGWKLEDAKARFSEVVRRARGEGPQRVTVRGKDAVVVISIEEMERLTPADPQRTPLVAFMEELHLDGLDLTRESDVDREIDL